MVYSLVARPSTRYCQINCSPIVNQTWSEYTATWTNSRNATDSYVIEANYKNLPAGGYIEVDLPSSFYKNDSISSISNLHLWWDAPDYYGTGNNNIQIASREAANPPILRITYSDIPPNAPTPTSPIGAYVINTNPTQFNWVYNSPIGGVQKKFDLMWSANGVNWNTVSQVTSNNFCSLPPSTLPTGVVYWKVVTYNEYDEASPESAVSTFNVVGAPPSPTNISASTDTAKPTISWVSSSQQIYQVQVLRVNDILYDSGAVASTTIKFQAVNNFLADGNYTAKVRVKNEYDLWSPWGSANFTVTTVKPIKPILVLSQSKYSVTATLGNITGSSYVLLYRKESGQANFICISKSTNTNTSVIDYTIKSNKEYHYFVRIINSNNTYMDSDIKTIYSPTLNKSVISPISNLSNVFEVKYNLNERPVKNITMTTPNTINYYSGRKYPVVEYSEHFSGGISITFFIKDDADLEQLTNIVNKKGTVLYRDGRRKIYGNLSGLNITDKYEGYIVNLAITQTDYDEEMEV